jgi:hypothetical protein
MEETNFPKKDQAHSLFESTFHEPGVEVEPLGDESSGFITDGQLERSAAVIGSHVGPEHRSHDRFDFAHPKLGDGLDLPAVLVEAGEEIQGVFHGEDTFFPENLRKTGSHSFNKLYGSLEVLPELPEFRLGRPGLAGEGGFILAPQIMEDLLNLQDPGLLLRELKIIKTLRLNPQSPQQVLSPRAEGKSGSPVQPSAQVGFYPLQGLQVGEIVPRSILDGLFHGVKDFVKSGWGHKKKTSGQSFEFIGNKLLFAGQEEKQKLAY